MVTQRTKDGYEGLVESITKEDKAILKAAITESGMTQKALGERIGMTQTAVSGNMTRDRMSLDMFTKLLNGMGYDVAVVSREDGMVRWIVRNE